MSTVIVRRLLGLGLACALGACGAAPLGPGPAPTPPPGPDGNERLPPTVAPRSYALDLTVDPAADRTRGVVDIAVTLSAPTAELRLHGDQMTFHGATVRPAGGAELPLEAFAGPQGGLLLRAPGPIPAGEAVLHLPFEAPLGEVPESLYRVREGDRWYAYTQFEPLEARGAFPCFDEPGFKVPWDITLRVPRGLRAFTNTPEREGERRLEGETEVHVFERTPPLPTYLIALAIGPFDLAEALPRTASTPLRIITTAGKADQAAFALQHTPRILRSLEAWFGRPYPYAKLDLVAVPNFSAGAMENPGLVTFREKLLLLDEKAPMGARAGTFGVVAHELAHMWFGDLVTMRWWDDLWLNEAFATWMATRTVQEVFPELESDIDQAAGAAGPMSLDAQPSARAIRQPINDGGDVYNAFDGITYGKGALVLGMIESWLGPSVFQQGVRRYLDRHLDANATTADLVAALEEVSGAPVGAVVDSFTTRPGTPLVSVEVQCPAGARPRLALSQARYRPADVPVPDVSPWRIPMCVRWAEPGAAEPRRQCLLFEGPAATVELAEARACPTWLHPNADERGYYRWTLPEAGRRALLTTARGALSLRERVVLPSLVGAWLEAGLLPIDEAAEAYLSLAAESHRTILVSAAWGPRSLFRVLGETPRPALSRRLTAAFGPHLDRLGLDPKPGEGPEIRFLRGGLVGAFADMAEDPRILARAREVAALFVATPEKVDPELAATFVPLAANVGDTRLWLALRALLDRPLDAGQRETTLRALSSFRDPTLVERTLALAMGDPLRAQDLRTVLGGTGAGREPVRRVAWRWIAAHYDEVVARVGDKGAGGLPFVAAGLCTPDDRQSVQSWFAARTNLPQGTERNLRLTLEGIDRCIAFKKRHAARAQAWLDDRNHSPSPR